jgi:hypothetical protein
MLLVALELVIVGLVPGMTKSRSDKTLRTMSEKSIFLRSRNKKVKVFLASLFIRQARMLRSTQHFVQQKWKFTKKTFQIAYNWPTNAKLGKIKLFKKGKLTTHEAHTLFANLWLPTGKKIFLSHLRVFRVMWIMGAGHRNLVACG